MTKLTMLRPRVATADTRRVKPPPKQVDAELGTRDWKAMRLRVKERARGMCEAEGCTRPGFYADHIVERRDGGAVFDMANLQWVCPSHHQRKTVRERMKRAHSQSR
ncbi:MAG: HNH endonuclease [Rhodospirillaceae bacterium]|nr:MAG: HNH endonuclease [Rhodospirillaceae bacterium]